ncbi:MAG: hypothetical protein JW804_07835 [Sedimentisphaerales bacterium]|nr:hypothetical protein [Sedimentisphaerales bacterium]
MKKHLIVIFHFYLLFTLTGCETQQPQQNTPSTQGLKITDLAPIDNDDIDYNLKTMNFDIITLEIPAENLSMLDEIWPALYTKPITLANTFSYKGNAFQTAFGEIQMWKQVGEIIDSAQAQQSSRSRFLMTMEKTENFIIKNLIKPIDIYYLNASLSPEILTEQTGRISLNFKADKPLGTRGVCSLLITPTLITDKPAPSKDSTPDTDKNPFEHLGLIAKMTPGDFLLIGPRKNYKQKDSLSSYFFHRKYNREKVLIYAVFCIGIND